MRTSLPADQERRLVLVLPRLGEELEALLRREGHGQLAAQVASLCLVDRCRCGDDFCSTVYTVRKPEGAWGVNLQTICLDPVEGSLNLDVLDGQIVCIEILHRPEIRHQVQVLLP